MGIKIQQALPPKENPLKKALGVIGTVGGFLAGGPIGAAVGKTISGIGAAAQGASQVGGALAKNGQTSTGGVETGGSAISRRLQQQQTDPHADLREAVVAVQELPDGLKQTAGAPLMDAYQASINKKLAQRGMV